MYVVIFLAFVTTILVVGRSTYTAQQRQFDLDLRQRIDQVADLKAKQVAAWRTERFGDAAVAFAGTRLMPAVPDVMRGASTPAAAEQLRA